MWDARKRWYLVCMFQICVQFLDDGAMYRDSIALVMNYVWLFIAAIHYIPPLLYVILWYGHITWYRPVHFDWRPSENWDHLVKKASTWSWSHDISVSSHVLSFYFGDWSCLRRIWPSSVFDIVVFGLWVSVQGFVSEELWKNWRWAFEWLSLCHLRLGMRHTHQGSTNWLVRHWITTKFD